MPVRSISGTFQIPNCRIGFKTSNNLDKISQIPKILETPQTQLDTMDLVVLAQQLNAGSALAWDSCQYSKSLAFIVLVIAS